MRDDCTLSLIVPVYAGERYLLELFDRICLIRKAWIDDKSPVQITELIFVDDASIDNSSDILNHLKNENSWVHVLTLSKNYGQHPSTVAGILHSSGKWVVTMDEDLQHPPEKIALLLKKALSENLHIVYGAPVKGPHARLIRDVSSVAFKRIMVLLTGDIKIPLYNSFRLIYGDIARSACSVCSHNTYLDVSFSWFTDAVGKCELVLIDDRANNGQKSGYSLLKLFSHAFRLLISTKIRIYRISAMLGIALFLIGVTLAVFILVTELIYPGNFGLRGWPSLISAILLFGSISLFLSSVILEYISDISLRVQGKPVYYITEKEDNGHLIDYLNQKCE
jgi:glycosyltransferase involved in cell wall biosynthesis